MSPAFFGIDESDLLIGAISGGNAAREPVIFIGGFGDQNARIARIRAGLHDPLRVAPAVARQVGLNDQDKLRFYQVSRHKRR